MNSVFVNRIIRACKLDVSLYEEVEADKNATFQAALVVVLSSLAAGVGAISLGASNFLIAPEDLLLTLLKSIFIMEKPKLSADSISPSRVEFI